MNQLSASAFRRITFRSKGGVYSGIFTSDAGDLYQEYDGSPTNPTKCYPDWSQPGNKQAMYLVISSSRSTNAATPASVEYSVAGTTLTFGTGNPAPCTTPGFTNLFQIEDGNMTVINNLVSLNGGNGFDIIAKAFMDANDKKEFVVVPHRYSCKPHDANSAGKAMIVAGDKKYFTIDEKNGSCILKAQFFDQAGWITPAANECRWDQLVDGVWKSIATSGNTLTVTEASVNTYSVFRLTVTRNGNEYQDAQDVMDRSDPLDILIGTQFAESAAATPKTTNDLNLDSDMDPTAYLLFAPKLVVRGELNSNLSGTETWHPAVLVNAAGVNLMTINVDQATKKYKITVQDLLDHGGDGDYNFVVSCTLNQAS